MSQYAFIPILKSNELQETYSIATPKTWVIKKGVETFGGLEDYEFTDAQKMEIEALGGQWFEDGEGYINWLNTL